MKKNTSLLLKKHDSESLIIKIMIIQALMFSVCIASGTESLRYLSRRVCAVLASAMLTGDMLARSEIINSSYIGG